MNNYEKIKNKIKCFFGFHNWSKSPKIIQHQIITDKHCDAIYKCQNCNKLKIVAFNCYTGKVYKKYQQEAQDE